MAKLQAVRVSENPTTKSKEVLGGIDGKASVTENGNVFIIMEFLDDSNMFKHSRATRLYWLGENGKWPGATPAQMVAHQGKEVPGSFITQNVLPYDIEGKDGIVRQVSTYTTFVMQHENKLTVFANEGYTVLGEGGEVLIAGKVRDKAPAGFTPAVS